MPRTTPINAVAAALGISYQHCYRERATVSKRVARFIYEHHVTASVEYLSQLDEFQVLMDRASCQIACGDLATADAAV